MIIHVPSKKEVRCDICGRIIASKRKGLLGFLSFWEPGDYLSWDTYKFREGGIVFENDLCYPCRDRMITYLKNKAKEKNGDTNEKQTL